jgi:hypothetical protein
MSFFPFLNASLSSNWTPVNFKDKKKICYVFAKFKTNLFIQFAGRDKERQRETKRDKDIISPHIDIERKPVIK